MAVEASGGVSSVASGGASGGVAGGTAARAGASVRPEDERWMRRAVELAARGAGRTNPNPLVGAVVVRDGEAIGEGWHAVYGELHAERAALADCARRGADPRGATMYVTLEPCSHQGRQPPCADALVEAGLARVVVGSRDPNPLVSGRGVARLRAAGVQVDADVLRGACDALNQVFFRYITSRRPYVVAKWAMTADGRTAVSSGDSRWVSGPASRADAHALRNRLAAVMVGAGTVAADDPLLTCRLEGGASPVRVVCDTRLSISEDSALVRSAAAGEAPLVVACGPLGAGEEGAGGAAVGPAPSALAAPAADAAKADRLRSLGAEVAELPLDARGRVSLPALMDMLGGRGLDSVLLEGGARLAGSAFDEGLVDEAVAYIAPKAACDAAAPGPLAGAARARMAEAFSFGAPSVAVLGEDVRLCWRAGRSPEERALPCVADGPLYPGGATTAEAASGRAPARWAHGTEAR